MDRGRLESIQRNRSNTAGSKVKVERLKILLQNLKDGERQSKMRNDSLLKDFEKVNRLADDLDTKARKLKRVKQEYETYINTIYPQWKENIEFHKSPKLKTEEDLDRARYPSWRANKAEFSYIEDPYSQSQSRMSRIDDDRPPLIGSFKQNGRSPYCSQGFLNKSDKDIDNMSQAVPIFNGVRFEAMQEREKSVTNAGIIPHDTYLELNHNTLGGRNKFLDSNFSQRYEACNERTEGVRPVSLNITKLKEGEDISSFTILPQALALSPDGKLVLLPMMFSPEMLPPSNKNEMSIYKRGINENIMETGANTVDEETKNIGSDQSSKSVFNERKTTVSNAKDKSTARHDIVHDGLYPRKKSIDDSNSQVKVFDKKTHSSVNEQYSALDGYVKTNSSNIGKNALPVASIGDDKGIDYSDVNTAEAISSKNGLAEVNPKVSDKTEINANTVNEIEMTRSDYDEIIEEENQVLMTEEKLKSSVDDFQENFNVLPEKNHSLNTSPEGKDNLYVAAAAAVKSDLMPSVTEQQVTFASLELGLGQSDENMNKSIEKDFYKESNGRPLDAGNLNRSHEGSNLIDGKVPLDEGQVLREIDECLNGNDRYEKNADDKTDERENEAQERNDNVIEEGKEKVLDVPEISYLFEEIENRMETIDRKEFYRKPIENAEADVLKRIKKSLLLHDNLNEFDTCDLCIVSRQSLAEFVMLNSKDGCIVRSHVDLSAIYTLDGFREILSSDFEELWEYVFNHMELLAANEIFESAIVCQIFSKLLSPGNESMALMVSQAIQRILDGEDDDVIHEDDEKSFCDEESSREGSQSGIASRGFQVIDGGNGKANEYSFHSSTDLKDPKPLVHAESDKSSKTLETQKETERKIKSKSSEKKDLSLDLGSISNGESDDDDDSTFDSAKLTPHKTFEEPHEQSHTQDLYDGRDDEDEDTVSNDRSNLSPEDKQEGQNEIANSSIDEDSDEDLEDMLSTSLVLNGSKNDKDLPKYEPTFAVSKKEDNKPPLLFKSNHDSFEVDESLPQRIEENSLKNDILSPGNSKSISSKFRRPGFWENSDSESEIADLNVSGGNDLSDQNDKEDEFDFDFYN